MLSFDDLLKFDHLVARPLDYNLIHSHQPFKGFYPWINALVLSQFCRFQSTVRTFFSSQDHSSRVTQCFPLTSIHMDRLSCTQKQAQIAKADLVLQSGHNTAY